MALGVRVFPFCEVPPSATTDETELWQMADALCGSAAEYKHVVLGLIFLEYISDAFEERHALLESERKQGADPEDPDEKRGENIFWVPPGSMDANVPQIGQAGYSLMLFLHQSTNSPMPQRERTIKQRKLLSVI